MCSTLIKSHPIDSIEPEEEYSEGTDDACPVFTNHIQIVSIVDTDEYVKNSWSDIDVVEWIREVIKSIIKELHQLKWEKYTC